ncbi:MAG: HEPN domain-containing protein [Pseudomonadota bacterium]
MTIVPYTDRLQLVDGLTPHLDTVVVPGLDPVLTSKYVGFLCVSAVTVIELAVKDILVEFAARKHKVFGGFCQDLYDRLNGRITLNDLRKNHVKRFGDRYVTRFDRLLNAEEDRELRASGRSIRSSYGNLITWRHSYAHQGILPPNASYGEAKQGFELGKHILKCLDTAMRR